MDLPTDKKANQGKPNERVMMKKPTKDAEQIASWCDAVMSKLMAIHEDGEKVTDEPHQGDHHLV